MVPAPLELIVSLMEELDNNQVKRQVYNYYFQTEQDVEIE